MKTNVEKKIYNELLELLGSKHTPTSSGTENINFTAREFLLIQRLDKIEKSRNFTCREAFDLFREIFDIKVSPDENDYWLVNCYKYSLCKSFPHVVEIAVDKTEINNYELYLSLLSIINKLQMYLKDDTWQSKYPLLFLSSEEESSLENPEEYNKFIKAFKTENIYEMMKLNQELLGYSTLDHICGVHYLALFIARQLKSSGLPIDLGRVSGAAAGHDIGKYGCRGSEAKRVPYLHYYYTDQWFKKHNITYIRNIAINHSTWDLELENLSLESLILIYSDFRVKNKTVEGKNRMHIFSLKDSFEVILNKLDNVDEMKLQRYQKVYAKLRDFESFLLNIGICIDPDLNCISAPQIISDEKYNYSLIHGEEIVDNIKYLSIHHNIRLMHLLRTESSLNSILELARSEGDWKNLRQYLQIFEEYSTYLTQKQKLITLKFLYDELTHAEEDIRRKSAELIGILIAEFDEDYRKEVPENTRLNKPEVSSADLLEKYMEVFLNPDHRIIPAHRNWIGYSLSTMIDSLFSRARRNQVNNFKNILLKYFEKDLYPSNETKLYLLNLSRYIPLTRDEESFEILYDYIIDLIDSKSSVLRVLALDVSRSILEKLQGDSIFSTNLRAKILNDIRYSRIPSENYLHEKLSKTLDLDIETRTKYASFCKRDQKKLPYIFLSNLKTATEWVIKKLQVEMLLTQCLERSKDDCFYTAMHFCNLLKVSAVEGVRNSAGDALIKIIPFLSHEQRNDVSIELLRGLEIEGYRFAEFIPYFLGQAILYLNPVELDEIIDDLIDKIKTSEPRISSLLLRTIGIAIANYPKYEHSISEEKKYSVARLSKMLGVLLNGLVNFNIQVKQMAFRVIGKELFGSKRLSLDEKHHIFKLICKKILTLLNFNKEEELMFLTKAAALNHIYRFISEYSLARGSMDIHFPDKIAFFPGTFDPFSLGHKEIVRAIRDLGFEVYLTVDEFSWSKQTRPHLIRRNIIDMSIADEPMVYLFPGDIPVNIANHRDLSILRKSFPNSEVYIVVGSDVLTNASAYRELKDEHSIHNFNHIIFKRNLPLNRKSGKLNDVLKTIDGDVIKLSLEPQYEDISSTQIRDYIDQNRDIASLIDPLAQRYIYEYGYYQREPQYKSPIQTVSIDVDIVEDINEELTGTLSDLLRISKESVYVRLRDFMSKPSARIILLKDIAENNRIIAFSLLHWVRVSDLYHELKNSLVSEYVRENAVGRIALIGGFHVDRSSRIKNLEQITATETLAFSLARDYDYAVYRNIFPESLNQRVDETLLLQGFIELPHNSNNSPVYVVNMSSPCTLSLDLKTILKEPFKSNRNVNLQIKESRKKLQEALTKLYPGNLILSFNRNMLHETLIRKICLENSVPPFPITPRLLGEAMCVPFGNILKRNIVPNTVTKSLHTEKLFSPDLKNNTIGPFPNYLSLENQVRMLRSFDRPVILVDDILHKGYRMKALDPILKDEKIKVQKIIVGILSGRGKELMDIQDRQVESAYYIPKLKVWFNENTLYPFMGGDSVWRGDYPARNLIPSINMILPYASPTFIRGTTASAIYNLSKICIENAAAIMSTLEKEYQTINERNLILGHLGQVFISPRCPEKGLRMNYDLNLRPSHYLENDLEMLQRIEFLLSRD